LLAAPTLPAARGRCRQAENAQKAHRHPVWRSSAAWLARTSGALAPVYCAEPFQRLDKNIFAAAAVTETG
jgi:hypothetical protein